MEVINAIGRRKSSVARVYVSEGTGKITINKKDLEVYFPSAILQYVVKQPLNLLEVAEKYDIKVNLDGGGFTGQSQALRLAIARALVKINADKVVFTGKKETDKVYTRYTGYPGGQRFNTPAELRKKNGGVDKMLRHAVKGMLPKGPLGRSLLNNLYIYEGTEHPHAAQQPKTIDINQYK